MRLDVPTSPHPQLPPSRNLHVLGFTPAAPDREDGGGIIRVNAAQGLDAVLAGADGTAPPPDLAALGTSQVVFLAPPVPVASQDEIASIAAALAPDLAQRLDRQRDHVEYRITIDTGAPQTDEAGADIGSVRVVARIAQALGGLAQSSAPTPQPLRGTPKGTLLMALSLLVHSGQSGRFLAKAKSLRSYAREAGLFMSVSGPHLTQSFALSHDLVPATEARRVRWA